MEELKTINIHQDYPLYQMVRVAKASLNTLVSYMQDRTPYGNEYEKAYNEYEKLLKQFEIFEDVLQDTVELRCKKED